MTNSHVDSTTLGHVDFMREILSRTKELVTKLDSKGSSPLHLASTKGYTEIVRELLRINSDDCYVIDKDGRTPLHLATMNGRVDVIK
jgi:ankyrin repeat protein